MVHVQKLLTTTAIALAVSLALLEVRATAQNNISHQETQNKQQLVADSSAITAPRLVTNRVMRKITTEYGINRNQLSISSATAMTWSDSCLGLGQANESCALSTVPGWQVVLTDGYTQWSYRTDHSAQVIREERAVADVETFPRLLASRILQTAADETGLNASDFSIASYEARTWDGCMGLPSEPMGPCNMIAIAGWRVVVTGPEQVRIYHTNADGTQIVLNETATEYSNPNAIVPQFIPWDVVSRIDLDWTSGEIVFASLITGGFAPTEQYVLYQDGRLMRYGRQEPCSTCTYPAPELIRQLSAADVADFQQILFTHRIDRFAGLFYPVPMMFTDYRSVTLLGGSGMATKYDGLSAEQLPENLRIIAQSWQALTTQ
jgi:hypothetical protein